MSLTGQLAHPGSRVRRFVDEHLPHSRQVVGTWNRELAGAAAIGAGGEDDALVGTAADLLIRSELTCKRLTLPFAQRGARDRRFSIRADVTGLALIVLHAALDELAAVGRPARASNADIERAVRSCLTIARFEQNGRAANGAMSHLLRMPLIYAEGDPAAFYAYSVPAACHRDLLDLAPALMEDHQDLAAASRLAVGPNFALTDALGGCDADLIADGLLLDLKLAGAARPVARRDVLQLVGYVLADTLDSHRIRSAGISALRRRRWICWPVEDLLEALSGQARPLADWRQEFAAAVSASPRRALRQP